MSSAAQSSGFPGQIAVSQWAKSRLQVLVCFVSVLGWSTLVRAEVNREVFTGTFLPSNRLDARGIQRARELIAKGEFSQSIRFLDEILARQEDSFVAGDQGEYLGLKETARQILKEMPPEGGKIYEATFGPVARRLLQQSTLDGDVEKLREIARRYFYTPAGYEAALLFAQSEADQGRFLTAALTYDQLLQTPEAAARFQPQLSLLAATSWLAANNPARAEEVLGSLSDQDVRRVQLSGQDLLVQPSRHGMVEWLLDNVGAPAIKDLVAENQWLTMRGNPSRNGKTEGGLPHLRVRWQVRLLEHQNLERVHDEVESLRTRQRKSRLPAAVPLAVGDYIIVRSAQGLVAIDFRTGKRIWRAQPERDSLLQDLMDGATDQNDKDIQPAQSFAQTLWEDFLYSSTSSDGQRVYVIRDLAPAELDRSQIMPFWQQNSTNDTDRTTNRLCAYDLSTQGKLLWEIDGAVREDQLQGAFFLGAPVAVGQSLYCLAEIKSDTAIYLMALDRKTGELQWRQQLVDLERSINLDVTRRLQASIPSYDEGMLVCPTGAGVVVGVDLAKQALAWAYRYPNQKQLTPRQRLMQQRSGLTKQQWVHCAPVIADGRILLTAGESDELHCLDLMTGKLLWKQQRGDLLYLAGVEQETILLVGSRNVSALRLADGRPAWDGGAMELPGASSPTGMGFFDDGQYYLPLSNAQVVAIDVLSGELTAAATSRDGQVLGNLICYRGSVISQTGRHLDCFDQIEVLKIDSERRLGKDANDFEALRTLGEIAYNDGRLGESLELLVRAHKASSEDLHTREVLAEALVAALDADFEEHRDLLPLLTEIQEQTLEAQITLMRLQAQGLQSLGQSAEAFEVCLNAYRRMASMDVEMLIGHQRTVNANRWLAKQVHVAWSGADETQRRLMAEQLTPLVEEIRSSVDSALRQEFYDCFESTELTDQLGLDLVASYLADDKYLPAQQILIGLVRSEDDGIRAAAVARSSELLHRAGKPFLATEYDEILRTQLNDTVCLDGKTGLQCLADWVEQSESASRVWPYGQVEVRLEETKTPRGSSSSRIPNTGINLERCDSILGNCNLTLAGMVSGRNRALTIQDSLGRNFFTAKLDESARSIINSQAGVYGVSRGNLLVLSLGRQIVAFDTLSPGGEPLWRKDTTSSLNYVNQSRAALNSQLRRHRTIRSQNNGNWLGVIGPVTRESCVFQVEERLICVDSLTGEVRWARDNLPLGCDLFGDDEHVIAVPKDAGQALVFSTVDGRIIEVNQTSVPEWQERLATRGQQVIRWSRRVDRTWELSSIDSLSGEVMWSYGFEKNSRVDIDQNRFVSVAEPSGHCTVVDLEDGSLLVDEAVLQNYSLQQVHLMVSNDHFLVAFQQPLKIDTKLRYVNGFNTVDFTRPFAGQLYLFDRRTGQQVWEQPAQVEGLPLMLDQGVDLPMITFAGNIVRRDKQGSKREIGLMLLEKSTGRMLFHQDNLPPSAHYCLVHVSDDDPDEAVVEMINRRIRLKFTDQPRPPEPPAMSQVQRNAGQGSKGLKKIGENLLRGL